MKRLLLLTVMAVMALGAFASSAFAEVEILPTPSEKAPLTFTGKGTTPEPKLTTTAGLTITCTQITVSGSFTTINVGTAKLDFEKCKEDKNKVACTAGGKEDEKETILVNETVQLVDFQAEPLELGAANTVTKFTIKCGILSDTVEGTALCKITGVTSLVKTKTATLVCEQTKNGEQTKKTCLLPEAFCKGKEYKLTSNLGLGAELASELATVPITFNSEPEVHF